MANISDIIESFILKTLGDDDFIDISRNDLASFFSCANSQINYVLDTRFTVDKGFTKESHRGGGGFIRITRVPINEDNLVNNLILESVGDELTFKRLKQIVSRLLSEGVITYRESNIILSCLSDESMLMPLTIKDKLRATQFKNILLQVLVSKEN